MMRGIFANYLKIGTGLAFGLALGDTWPAVNAVLIVSLVFTWYALDRD